MTALLRCTGFVFCMLAFAVRGLEQEGNTMDSSTPKVRKTGQSAIVVGAGMAGMAAAKTLSDAGYTVTVLEANDRIGGRLLTEEALDGLKVELGAQWIHGTKGNPVTQLARSQNLNVRMDTADTQIFFASNGRRRSDKEVLEAYGCYERMLAYTSAAAERKETDSSLWSYFNPWLSANEPNPESRAACESMANSNIAQEFAADLSHGPDGIVAQGYTSVLDGWRDLPRTSIKLEEPVSSVEYGSASTCSSSVKVVTSKSTYTADKVIVAVPLGQLKVNALKISPALPASHTKAIERLGFGVLNKVIMRFDKPFWDPKASWLTTTISQGGGETLLYVEYYSLLPVMRVPVLVFFTAGTQAVDTESLSDKARVDQAMGQLRKMYGADTPDPTSFIVTKWHNDPHTRGSYSYYAVGSTPKDRRALATPVCDTVFFAGEHVNIPYFATVHGAYYSGIDAGKKAIRS